MMDARQQAPQQSTQSYEAAPSLSSRPTLGFPLGTALLLIVIFCISGVLSCCYHWDKLQSLRRRALGRGRGGGDDEENASNGDDAVHGIPPPPSKASPMDQHEKQDQNESLPVIMPGDRIPKFIAWPCPCDRPSFAAPPRASDVPPQLDKLVTVDGRSSPTPPPPSAAVSSATTHVCGPTLEPTVPLNTVV